MTELLDRNLQTGTPVVAGDQSGPGEWTIDNGLARDAVVAITQQGSKVPLYSVYIGARAKYTLTGLRDGTYSLFFTMGKDWNGARFTRSCDFTRFDDPFQFTTTATTYTVWEVGLKPVVGGTAKSKHIDPDAFPAIR